MPIFPNLRAFVTGYTPGGAGAWSNR